MRKGNVDKHARKLNHTQPCSSQLQKCSSQKYLEVHTSVYSCQTNQSSGSSLGPVSCSDLEGTLQWIERASKGRTNMTWERTAWAHLYCWVKVWQQSLSPDPETLDGYSKTGWSHPSCHIHLLWAACGSSVHLRYRSEEGAGSAHSLKMCNLCCSTSE